MASRVGACCVVRGPGTILVADQGPSPTLGCINPDCLGPWLPFIWILSTPDCPVNAFPPRTSIWRWIRLQLYLCYLCPSWSPCRFKTCSKQHIHNPFLFYSNLVCDSLAWRTIYQEEKVSGIKKSYHPSPTSWLCGLGKVTQPLYIQFPNHEVEMITPASLGHYNKWRT